MPHKTGVKLFCSSCVASREAEKVRKTLAGLGYVPLCRCAKARAGRLDAEQEFLWCGQQRAFYPQLQAQELPADPEILYLCDIL